MTISLEIQRNLRRNLIANLVDGGFFGFALGFASFVTVIPLFVSTMTDSAILIGLIPAIHTMGWQLPQLFTANRVARLSRYKPMVMLMTINERVPFFGLAVIAWFAASLSRDLALILTFVMLSWQGLGGGFTATAWQAMIGKIIPPRQRGSFYGMQSSAANLLGSVGAVFAGIILAQAERANGFAICFLMAFACMVFSWFALNATREPEVAPPRAPENHRDFWSSLPAILRRDTNFRGFLFARMLAQFGLIGSAFYVVYIVHRFNVSEELVGVMTAVLLVTQIVAHPLAGWLGDRVSHRAAMLAGGLALSVSAVLAWWAPEANWFFLVLIFTGIGLAAVWTPAMAMIPEFGTEADRPHYIGMANTLIAPSTILAPIIGGWIADRSDYPTAFIAAAIGGLATAVVLWLLVRDPRHARAQGAK